MSEEYHMQRLENELRKTEDIIHWLEYQLMGQRAWKKTTEFRIDELRGLTSKVRIE